MRDKRSRERKRERGNGSEENRGKKRGEGRIGEGEIGEGRMDFPMPALAGHGQQSWASVPCTSIPTSREEAEDCGDGGREEIERFEKSERRARHEGSDIEVEVETVQARLDYARVRQLSINRDASPTTSNVRAGGSTGIVSSVPEPSMSKSIDEERSNSVNNNETSLVEQKQIFESESYHHSGGKLVGRGALVVSAMEKSFFRELRVKEARKRREDEIKKARFRKMEEIKV